MKQVVSPLLLFIFLALSNFSFAQSCECVNCPRVASANSITNIRFGVSGATNNDLSDQGQGVCGVYIEFAPDHIWSLEMILTSPSGQQVTLIGPPSNTGFFSGSQTWEILFLPCSETVEPDPGFPNTWNNSTSPFTIGSAYDGSYYPHSGCLEDFNTGTVDGNWNLSVNNISPFNGAFIWDFKVIFCDDSGLDCFPCDADAGSIAGYPDIVACPGDPVLEIDMNPDYGITPGPDESLFGYTYIITENDVILDYDTLPDLSAYPSGIYTICGLSYLLEDSLDIPGVDGNLTLTEFNDDLASVLPPFCGIVTDDCLEVEIQDVDTTFLSGIICQGEEYPFDGQNYDTTGVYYFSFPGGGPCGRAVVLDLLVLDSIQTFLQDTICTGEDYCIGSECFSTTGNYQVQLTSTVSPFCDSFVNLSLQVVPNPTLVIRDTICLGDSVVIEGTAFFNTGNYNIFPDPLITCDTFFRLRLVVIDPIIEVIEETICVGDSLEVDGQFFDSTGIYEITYTSAAMCDSILQINLTVLDSIIVPIVDNICAGDTSWIDGMPFFESGYYEVDLTSYFDCDSLVQLDLTVQDTIRSFITDTICDGETYIFGTENLQTTGLYNVVLPSTTDCDTFATLDLVVLAPILVDIDSTVCQGEIVTIGTREYNETGIHNTTLVSVNGCDSVVRLDLVVLSPSAIITSGDLLLGCENNPVRLDASNSDGMNLIYEWIDLDNGGAGIILGADSVVAFVSLAGTYQLIVTDTLNGKSCSVNNFVGVAGDLNKPVVFTNDGNLTCEDTSIVLDVVVLSSGLDFSWTGPGTFQDTIQQPTVNEPGNYTLITTGINQCKDTSIITIVQNDTLPEITIQLTDSLDCNTLSIPLEGAATGDIDNYLWTGPGTFQSPFQNITVSLPGAYTFTATTISGCQADSTVWITIDTISPEATVVGDTIICDGMDAQLSAESTDLNLLFNWEGPGTFNSTLPDPTVLVSGIYDLTITATNACSTEYSVEVQIDTIPPSLSILGGNLTCDSTTIEIMTVSDPDVVYSWNGPGTFNTTIPNPIISEGGTYYLTVTSLNLCEAIDSITILQDTFPPNANANGGVLLCNPDTVQIAGNSTTFGSSFSWTGPSGFSTTIQNPFVSQAGEYTLMVTGLNGCTSTAKAMVTTDNSLPDISLEKDTIRITCLDSIAQLMGESSTVGASFLWTGPVPFIDTTLPNPTTNIPGTYYFTVLGLNGCESIDSVEVVDNRIPPNVTVEGGTIGCLLDSIKLEVIPLIVGANILWEGPGLFTSTILEPFVTEPGEYILTLITANGCESKDTVTVTKDNSFPDASATVEVLYCGVDSVQLNGSSITPGVSYTWIGPSFFDTIPNPFTNDDGLYTLYVTGPNGCETPFPITVVRDTMTPQLSFTITDTLDCLTDSIQISSSVTLPVNSYSWSGPNGFASLNPDLIVRDTGFYTLSVVGDNFCVNTDSVLVTADLELPDVEANGGTLNCYKDSVTLNGDSQTSGVTYSWSSDGAFTSIEQEPTVYLPGEYYLTVVAPNGCPNYDTTTVAIDTLTPTATASGGILGCLGGGVTLSGTATGQIDSIFWKGPGSYFSSEQNPTVFSDGMYFFTVISLNGCSHVDTAFVTEDMSAPGADINSPEDSLTCVRDSIILLGSADSSFVSYFWSGPDILDDTLQDQKVSIAGVYTLVTTGLNGCTSFESFTVFLDTLAPDVLAVGDTLTCLDSLLQISGSSATPNVDYLWTGPGIFNVNDQAPIVNELGEYILMVTAENGCSSDTTINVIDLSVFPEATAVPPETLSCSNDSIQLEASSTTAGVTFSWTGPDLFYSDLQNPYIKRDGEYILEVLSAKGCSSFDTILVEIDTLSPDTDAIDGILDCLGGGVDLYGSSGTAGFEYYWEGPGGYVDSIANPSVTASGMYYLTVTASNGCTSRDTANVLENLSAPGGKIIGDTLNCNIDSIQLTVDSTSGVSFTWTGPQSFSFNGQNPYVSELGTYFLTVLGANGCPSNAQFELTKDSIPPEAIATGDTLGCIPEPLQVFADTVGTDVLYSWTSAGFTSNEQNPIVPALGEYVLIVTGANGCTDTDTTFVIEDKVLPDIDTITMAMLNCKDTMVQISGSSLTPGVTYSWEGPGGFTSMQQSPMVDTVGEYILTVLSLDGCTATDTIIVESNTEEPPVISIGDSLTITCANPLAELSVSSSVPVTYSWEGPNGFSSILQNPTTQDSGQYIVTMTAENFCVSTDIILVLIDSLMPGAEADGDLIDCTTGPFFLEGDSPSSNVQYYWEGPAPFVPSNNQNPEITFSGKYFLTVTGSNGCISLDSFTVVEDVNKPQIDPVGDTLICQPDSVEILSNSTTLGVTFNWSGPDGFTSEQENPFVDTSGTYQLVVTSLNGCTTLDSAIVINNKIYPNAIAIGGTIDCDSTQITLLGSSDSLDVEYYWLDPNGSILNEQYPLVSEDGEYLLFVSGQNQCVTTQAVDVFRDVDVPQISATGGVLNCSIDSVLIIGSSTTPSVTYEWIGPDTLFQSNKDSVMIGDAGAYTFTVESSNGCLAETTIMVTIDTIVPTFNAFGDILDCITGDGFLEVNSTIPGNTYSWTGPMNFVSNLENPMVNEIGQYQVVVTGLNTCKDSILVEVINEPNVPVSEAGETEDLDCNSFDVELNGSSSAGDPDLEYLWINGEGIDIANSAIVNVDSAGVYYLQVTNPSNGCSDIDSIIVAIDTIAPLAVVDLIGGQSITCAQTSIVLDGTGSISTDSLFYNWWLGGSVISTEINPEISNPGSYSLVIMNAGNACSDTTSFDILLDNDLPSVVILSADTLNCYQDTIFLDASNSDLGPEYELEWFSNGPIIISGDTTAMPLIDQPGNYTLSILNTQNGCKDSASIDVFSDFVYPMAEAGEGGTLNCHEPVYVLNGNGSSTGVIYNYLWNGPGLLNGENGLEPEVNQPGLYVLEVLNDINGCGTLDSVVVEEGNLGPSNALIDLSPPPCFGEEEGEIYIDEVIGGVGPFLYSLNGTPYVSWSQFEELGAGTYAVNIQDVDGCEFDTTLTLVDPLPLVVQLEGDTLIQLGESLTIDPIVTSGAFDLEWSYNPFLTCDTCLLQDFIPFRTSKLILTVTDQNGCIAFDEQTIYVEDGDIVFVPSAFTPDGDGTNDLLELFPSSGVAQVKTFFVFDRWGEIVHERKNFLPGDPGHGWDGRLKGKPMNPAVFVYFAELELVDGSSKFFEGTITLMR